MNRKVRGPQRHAEREPRERRSQGCLVQMLWVGKQACTAPRRAAGQAYAGSYRATTLLGTTLCSEPDHPGRERGR